MTHGVLTAPPRALRPCPLPLIAARDVRNAHRLVVTGELVRVEPGVFAPASAWHALPSWDRYLTRVHAVLLLRPGAVPCLESAAVLQRMPVFGDPGIVHLLDGATSTSRRVGDVRTHTGGADREIVELDGIPVVGVVDTVVDLARSRHHAIGLAVADAALRAFGAVHAEMLVAANESRASSRGRRHARWVTHRATALAETPLESVSRAAVEWLGFDDPALQEEFTTDGHVDRADMWWHDARAVGEADGDIKYDGSLNPGREAIRREKDRDRRLRRHSDGVAHWGWSDVVHVDPLRAELQRAGLQVRHPVDSRELFGLRALTRRA